MAEIKKKSSMSKGQWIFFWLIILFIGFIAFGAILNKIQHDTYEREEKALIKQEQDSTTKAKADKEAAWLALPASYRDSVTSARQIEGKRYMDSLRIARPLAFVDAKLINTYGDLKDYRMKVKVTNRSTLDLTKLTLQITPMRSGKRSNSYPETIEQTINAGDSATLELHVGIPRADAMNNTITSVDVQLSGATLGNRELYYPELTTPDGYVVKHR